ncbi:hypothetical protein P3L10_007727 [Capsicum annuum]
MDELQDSQKHKLQEALDMSEVTTGRGLNQQLGLSRACDIRWGSHYKSFSNFILMFGSILDVLESLVLDAQNMNKEPRQWNILKLVEHLRLLSCCTR